MKKRILILQTVFICSFATAQSVVAFGQKVKIVADIIEKITKTDNLQGEQKIVLTGFIDTKYRATAYEEGYSYNGIRPMDLNIDHSLLDTISKIFPEGLFYEDNHHRFFRKDIVTSSGYVARDSCTTTCQKIYFEIMGPMEGWQNVGISNYLVDITQIRPLSINIMEKTFPYLFLFVLLLGKKPK